MKRLKLWWYIILITVLAGCSLIKFGQEKQTVVDRFALEYKQLQKSITVGDKALQAEELDQALKAYQQAIAIKPEASKIHVKIGQIYLRQKEYDKAINAFKTGLKYAPGNLEARNYLGYLYEKTEKNKKAAREYKRVLKSDPKNLYALNHLGLMQFKLGRLDEAETVLRKALKIDPDCRQTGNKDVHNYLGLVYEERGDIGEAIAEYRESIRLNPDELWARKHLGSLYEEYGRYFEAQLIYLDILKIDPENAFAASRLKATEQFSSPQPITEIKPVEIVEDDVDAIIANAPSSNQYPEADAIILLDKFSHELLDDGTSRYTTHQIVKVLTERGIKKYGEIAIAFHFHSQNIGVNIARTILPDGNVVEPPDEAYNDVTAPGFTEYNLFSDMMWKVIAMPALTPGAVIEYKVTLEDALTNYEGRIEKERTRERENGKKGKKEREEKGKRCLPQRYRASAISAKWFWGDMSFQSTDPTLRSKCALRVPEDMKFKWKAYNCQINPAISIKNQKITYVWDYGKTEALEVEPNMPPLKEVVPRLSYSSVDSWKEVQKWYYDLAKDQYEIDESIQKKVKELVSDARDRESKIRAIYNFVATKIRYVGIEFGQSAYQPSNAIQVFKHRYGDCKDKVTLLIAMLKLAQIKAYPAMINPAPYAKIDLRMSSPSQFAHLICAVPGDGKMVTPLPHYQVSSLPHYLWLDPTVETCSYDTLPYSDQGRHAFVITESDGFFVTTPIDQPEANKLSMSIKLEIDSDGTANGVERVKTTGQFSIDYRFLYKNINPKDLVDFFEMVLNQKYPGVKVHDVNLSGLNKLNIPFETVVKFSVDDYAFNSGMSSQLIIPIPGDNFSDQATMVSRQERKYRLETGYPMQIQKEVAVNIPEGYVIPGLPQPIDMEYGFGKFSRQCTLEGRSVKYRLRYTTKKSSITPSKYHLFKRFIEAISREDEIQLICRKSGRRENERQ